MGSNLAGFAGAVKDFGQCLFLCCAFGSHATSLAELRVRHISGLPPLARTAGAPSGHYNKWCLEPPGPAGVFQHRFRAVDTRTGVEPDAVHTALLQGSVCSGGRSPPRREAFAAYAGQLPNEKAGNSVPIELRRLCYDSVLVGFEEPGTVCGGSLAGSSWPTRELLAHCSPYAGRVDFLGG